MISQGLDEDFNCEYHLERIGMIRGDSHWNNGEGGDVETLEQRGVLGARSYMTNKLLGRTEFCYKQSPALKIDGFSISNLCPN